MDSHKFEHLLHNHEITPQELFSIKGITTQIKNNIDTFVNFLKRHKNFTTRMFTLGLNITYQQLESQLIKNVSFAITELLNNQEQGIAHLFFQDLIIKNSSEISEKIVEEPQCTIQTEAERLFQTDQIIEAQQEQTKQNQQERPIEIQRYQVAKLSLQILKEKEKNQTCLGHLSKIYSFLIRHDSGSVLSFFSENLQQKRLLLDNLQYSSISNLLAQLLSCEDKGKQYKHEGFKREIVQEIIELMIENIANDPLFDGLINVVDEIFNSTKQSYYEYFQDFKRVANLLVSEQTINKFCQILFKTKEESAFKNASRFLQTLLGRIHAEKADNNYYNRGDEAPTMNFQINQLKSHTQGLIELTPSIESYNSITKITFISLLSGLFEIEKQIKKSINFGTSMNILLASLNRQKQAGILTSKIYNLIKTIIEQSTQDEVRTYLQINDQVYALYFNAIKNSNYNSTKQYNKNQYTAFDVAIIGKMANKNTQVFQNSSKIIGKDMKKIHKKYETKIAAFSPARFQSSSNEKEDDFFDQFPDASPKDEKTINGIPSLSLTNLIGKNNTSVPVLVLPEKIHKQNHTSGVGNEKEDHLRKEKEDQLFGNLQSIKKHLEVKEIIEEEEVKIVEIKLDSFVKEDVKGLLSKTVKKEEKVRGGIDLQSQIRYFVRHKQIYV